MFGALHKNRSLQRGSGWPQSYCLMHFCLDWSNFMIEHIRNPVLRLHQCVSTSSAPSLGDGFNFRMHSTTPLVLTYGRVFLRTQIISIFSLERFLISFTCDTTCKTQWLPFSSARKYCIGKLLKSCYYKLQTSCHCISSCYAACADGKFESMDF